MPSKLHLKRTPVEQAQHDLRKAARAARRAARSGEDYPSSAKRRRRHSRDSASDDPGPSHSGMHESEYEDIRRRVEEARFREKMFGALEDDERLDSVEARLNDFAHVPQRWRTAGSGAGANANAGEGDDGIDPRYMEDEEYAEWIRAGIHKRKYAAQHEEAARQKTLFDAAKQEAARLQRAQEEARQRRRRERALRRTDDVRAAYEARWRVLLAPPGDTDTDAQEMRFADVPWPVLPQASTMTGLEGALRVEHLTEAAIAAFLFPADAGVDVKAKGRETLLRFHPDKFEGRVMRRVRTEEQDLVREGVGAVVRAVNALMVRGGSS
ncbi:hypothetical protein DENSPDRAFT_879783 [Dentipellis sp. KUC8613]|nr:hypothetical protein DENSPDRAFT_879783 [Dentipellis sp. KUC8613]